MGGGGEGDKEEDGGRIIDRLDFLFFFLPSTFRIRLQRRPPMFLCIISCPESAGLLSGMLVISFFCGRVVDVSRERGFGWDVDGLVGVRCGLFFFFLVVCVCGFRRKGSKNDGSGTSKRSRIWRFVGSIYVADVALERYSSLR